MFDRKQIKAESRRLLHRAKVSPFFVTLLYIGILLGLDTVRAAVAGVSYQEVFASGPLGIFLYLLVLLISLVLGAGFTIYCMGILRGEQTPVGTLFDGFSRAPKILALYATEFFFIYLWCLLFVIPGLVAAYRYHFAVYILLENPEITPAEAIRRSKAQTNGHKMDLFLLEVSFWGWLLLISLPNVAVNVLLLLEIPVPLSPVLLSLVLNVLAGVVQIYVLPYMETATLAYYEKTKPAAADFPPLDI